MNNASPEALGEFLRARAKYAKNTCERKGQISRVDAVCWYLAHVSHASSRDVKRFMTAFKGSMSLYSVYDPNTRTYTTKPDRRVEIKLDSDRNAPPLCSALRHT